MSPDSLSEAGGSSRFQGCRDLSESCLAPNRSPRCATDAGVKVASASGSAKVSWFSTKSQPQTGKLGRLALRLQAAVERAQCPVPTDLGSEVLRRMLRLRSSSSGYSTPGTTFGYSVFRP